MSSHVGSWDYYLLSNRTSLEVLNATVPIRITSCSEGAFTSDALWLFYFISSPTPILWVSYAHTYARHTLRYATFLVLG